uniref:GCN5-related N-acetyltransferase n=1 Tax=uncultured marine thaumarchaeote KM3_02_B09 TaxID=1455956 RepID=A0A075G7H7_9ARCH|nr:GCN5-related N-acetyltransferase [uncultured marine thaumarchaeote KM3_02_B09]
MPEESHLILRHDIDFDLGSAAAMAEFEANQGWHFHYFILIRTEYLNPLSGAGSKWVRHILELGHTIGLHFDARLYDPDPATLRHAIEEESAILETITDRPVNQFSLHRPHPEMLDGEFSVYDSVNAYAPRYFKDIGYCSDSPSEWRYGHSLDSDAVQSRRYRSGAA